MNTPENVPRTPSPEPIEPRAPSPEPKISIVTPSFNQGKYLEKTILSVLGQDYPNLEYIIIDGGSSDDSVEIIRKYADRLAYWESEPDRGQSHAINKGFARASGEIFGWLNSDDWYHPGALRAVAEAFAANPEAGAVVGAGEMVDEVGKVLLTSARTSVTTASLYRWDEEYFWQPSCFFRQGVWNECGPLDENIHYAMDLDFWIKIAKKYEIKTIAASLTVNLSHSMAKTTKDVHKAIVDSSFVVLRHGGEICARLLLQGHFEKLYGEIAVIGQLHEKIAALNIEIEKYKYDMLMLNNEIADKVIRIEQYVSALDQKDKEISMILNSISWKITRPVRTAIDFIKQMIVKAI